MSDEQIFYKVSEVRGWGGAVNLPTYINQLDSNTLFKQTLLLDDFDVEHKIYSKGLAMCLAEAVTSIIFLHYVILWFLEPISQHSFFIKAIERLYQVRTKDNIIKPLTRNELIKSRSRKNSI